jgi:capsid protein
MPAKTRKKAPVRKRSRSRPAKATAPDKRLIQLAQFRKRFAELKARYDAAVTNDDNRRHWANADSLSAADANSAAVRQVLRDRSRYESANNGYYAGIVRTRADDLIATGPKLQIQIEDDALSKAIEDAWNGWCKAVRLVEKLHTLDQARLRDGESFAVLVTNPMIADAVKLDVAPIEADRVADPRWRLFESAGDGIEYDTFGNPVSYTILREHPGSRFSFAIPEPEFDRFDARFVCHWFRCDRPGQLRGIPELTASLPLFAISRRWTLATVLAAEMAANFAIMLETDANPNSETIPDPPDPFETLEVTSNMMTALPIGTKAHQMAAEHPNAEYQNFSWELRGEQARPIRMPVNVASGDTSRSNFSSAKIDHLGYRHCLRVDRTFCESQLLERIYSAWFAEALTVSGYLPAEAAIVPTPHQWTWPGWLSWDKNEAVQDTEMLNNNTTTLAELLSEAGQDWRDVLRQRAKELELMEELGITPTAPAPAATQNGNGEKTDDDETEDEQTTDPPVAARARNRLNGYHLNGNGRGHK